MSAVAASVGKGPLPGSYHRAKGVLASTCIVCTECVALQHIIFSMLVSTAVAWIQGTVVPLTHASMAGLQGTCCGTICI